jgi:hypothetical protein
MQFSGLVFVLYINSLVSVRCTAGFSLNVDIPSDYRGTRHNCTIAVSSDIYMSTVSITRVLVVSVVNVREGREDDHAHAHNIIIHYSYLKDTDAFQVLQGTYALYVSVCN